MNNFKEQWDLEMALAVLQSQQVDGRTWSEAVKWLLLYGPSEIRELINQASSHATHASFPELTPSGYTADGQPCYDVQALAESLGISEEEVQERIATLEAESGVPQFLEPAQVHKIQ